MREKTAKNNSAGLRFDSHTIEDFAASLTLSPHSVASYKKCLAYFFTYLANKGIVRPESGDIAAYAGELSASGRNAHTVYSYIAAVRAFFRWTQSQGLYRDIAAEIPLPQTERMPNRKTLTAAQLRKVLDSIDRTTLQGKRDYAILAFMMTLGLSALEVSRAKIEDVHESDESCVLYIRDNDGVKRGSLDVPPLTMSALLEYLNARGYIEEPDAPLFISVSDRNRGKNEHMTAGSVSRIAKNALRNAGYDDKRLSAKSLKVSAMKLALQRGERLEDVQKFARHKQIRTTFLYEQAGFPNR